MSLLPYGEIAGRIVSGRIAAPVSGTANITAIPLASRVDGMLILDTATGKEWVYSLASTLAASANVLVPDSGAGRWVTTAASRVAATPIAHIDLKGAILAAGTPLGAYAGSTPGITLDNSKAVGIRWKGGTLTSIWTYVDLPLDLDPTFPVLATFLISKSGATAADVVSVTVACYAQTNAALEDAASNIGAATPALTSAQAQLAAKTVTKLQAPIYLPPTVPARLSMSVTPTGTLSTDDMIINGAWLEYTARPAVPRIVPDLKAAILAAGTPMAAWANNAASNPGVTLDNSKAVGIRWNNNAAQAAVWTSAELPLDMDVTKPCVVVVMASKSGATVGDATTFDVGIYQQTPAALEDANSNLGGTTGALVGNATAKTVTKLTLGIPGNTFAAAPSHLTITLMPTSGTLGTDDAVCNGFWIEYTKKQIAPMTPIVAIDLKAAVLAAGTPMAAFANNAGASAPGVTLNNSKAEGIRWNNFATQTAIWSECDLPLSFDHTAAATLVLLVSKSGATAADTATFDVAMYQQTVGALEDAGASLTGTTSAIAAPTAAAKTVAKLTLAIPAATFSAAPGRLSVSLKPTDGKLGTDDVLLCGSWIEYSPKGA